MPRELGELQRVARKLVPNMWHRGDGTHRHVRHGTHRSNQLGLRAKYSRNESSRYSRVFQHQPFDHGLEFPAGTRAGFAKATVRIHGTGWRWRDLLAFQRAGEQLTTLNQYYVFHANAINIFVMQKAIILLASPALPRHACCSVGIHRTPAKAAAGLRCIAHRRKRTQPRCRVQ
jgi:hypothetical protein